LKYSVLILRHNPNTLKGSGKSKRTAVRTPLTRPTSSVKEHYARQGENRKLATLEPTHTMTQRQPFDGPQHVRTGPASLHSEITRNNPQSQNLKLRPDVRRADQRAWKKQLRPHGTSDAPYPPESALTQKAGLGTQATLMSRIRRTSRRYTGLTQQAGARPRDKNERPDRSARTLRYHQTPRHRPDSIRKISTHPRRPYSRGIRARTEDFHVGHELA